MRKQVRWLLGEIDQWVREGILDAEQGDRIKNRYPTSGKAPAWGKVIFSAIGAILFGLGVILVFAYNWTRMHKFTKLAMVLSSLAAAHGCGIWLRRPQGKHPAAGEGLHLLGTMLFGAAIWLVAQIYHIDEHFPNAFLAWGLGALALAWSLPSVSQGIVASVLLVLWHTLEVLGFRNPNVLGPPWILAGIFPLAWHLRSRVLAATTLCSFLLALSLTTGRIDGGLLTTVLLSTSCAFLAAGLIMDRYNLFPESAPSFSWVGFLAYLSILYLLSFPDSDLSHLHLRFKDTAVLLYFSISALTALGLWGVVLWSLPAMPSRFSHDVRADYLAVPASLVVVMLRAVGWVPLEGWGSAILFNLLFLFHAIAFIIYGCKTVNIKLATAGCLLFFVLTVSRYVDLFESLLTRALVFLVVGTAIFMVGNFFTKAKDSLREKVS